MSEHLAHDQEVILKLPPAYNIPCLRHEAQSFLGHYSPSLFRTVLRIVPTATQRRPSQAGEVCAVAIGDACPEFRRFRHVSLSVFEAAANVAALKLAPVFTEVSGEWHASPPSVSFAASVSIQLPQVRFRLASPGLALITFRHDGSAFNCVLEFPDISGQS